MELVPIIYNSLFVVFVLLSSVIVISLFCSKLNLCGQSQDRRKSLHKQTQPIKVNRSEMSFQKELSANRIPKKSMDVIDRQTKIRKKLIDNNKVIVIKRAERTPQYQIDQRSYSRYSVVNTMYREPTPSNELYEKFSKMSVSYSQSA